MEVFKQLLNVLNKFYFLCAGIIPNLTFWPGFTSMRKEAKNRTSKILRVKFIKSDSVRSFSCFTGRSTFCNNFKVRGHIIRLLCRLLYLRLILVSKNCVACSYISPPKLQYPVLTKNLMQMSYEILKYMFVTKID